MRIVRVCALQLLSRFRRPWLECSRVFARRVSRAHAADQPACGRCVGASRLAARGGRRRSLRRALDAGGAAASISGPGRSVHRRGSPALGPLRRSWTPHALPPGADAPVRGYRSQWGSIWHRASGAPGVQLAVGPLGRHAALFARHAPGPGRVADSLQRGSRQCPRRIAGGRRLAPTPHDGATLAAVHPLAGVARDAASHAAALARDRAAGQHAHGVRLHRERGDRAGVLRDPRFCERQ